MTGDYTQALIDARCLINELRRQWLITAEEKKYRDRFSLGMFVGYDTSISLINTMIRDPTIPDKRAHRTILPSKKTKLEEYEDYIDYKILKAYGLIESIVTLQNVSDLVEALEGELEEFRSSTPTAKTGVSE